jgi:protein-disulfide isomerase
MSQTEHDEEDLTRKQRREQARSDRKAAEAAAASDAARRKRLGQLGAVVAVVVIAIVVILVATGGSSSSKKPPPVQSTAATQAVSEVNSTVGGIPQNGSVLGHPNAPVTLQYFGDLECPICREFTLGALPKIIQKWVREGKLKIEYRNLQTATREPETFRTQQTAALAAGAQQKMWNFIELFYHEQGEEDSGYVTEKYLQGLAQQIPGLNLQKWQSERTNQAYQGTLQTDAQEANNRGLTGTPAFLIGKSGGAMTRLNYNSLSDPTSFNEAIEQHLKE